MIYRISNNSEDLHYILTHLRKEDEAELKAYYGKNWKLKTFLEHKHLNNLIIGKDRNPVLIAGICQRKEDPEGIGTVMLLSTDEIKNYKIKLLREIKKEIEKADEKFWFLYNFIYKDNLEAKKWLEWLGFKFDKSIPENIKLPEGFELFYRIRPVKGLGE